MDNAAGNLLIRRSFRADKGSGTLYKNDRYLENFVCGSNAIQEGRRSNGFSNF